MTAPATTIGPLVTDEFRPSPTTRAVLSGLVGLGAVAFVLGVWLGSPQRVWGIFLVNLLFWSGLAATGPALAGMIEATEGRWGARLRRIATTTAAFMPASFFLFLVLLTALPVLYPWVGHPIPKKAVWLNVPFFVLRTVAGVGVLYWMSIRFARAVHASAAGAAQDPGRGERQRLAVILLLLYGVVISLLGFDLIMTLDPVWFSGLLGGYFLVTCLYSGFAFLVVLIGIRSIGRPTWLMPPAEIQDLAKLVFAMSVMWMYFFWSQYLVIWYGNVPIETRYLIARFFHDPYRVLVWIAFLIGWLIPFAYLLGRLTGRPPGSHRVLVGICCLSLTAIFLERIVLVLGSLTPSIGFATTVVALCVTAGFAALFALSYLVFVPRFGLATRIEA